MTAPCRSTHWLSMASAGSAFVSPNDPAALPSAHQSVNQIPLPPAFQATSTPPSSAPAPPWPSPPAPPSHRRSAPYLRQAVSRPHLLHADACPLSADTFRKLERQAPSSGSSPLLPPPAAAAQSAATLTIYHGDGSLVPSVEVLGDIPKYIYQGMHTIYYSLSIVSPLQLQGSRC